MSETSVGQPRQRLLYLHTSSPSVQSRVMAFYRVEPVPHGAGVDLSPEPKFPYQSVHEAMIDGWRVVRFPEYTAPVQDREIDMQGYEFILEKLEVFDD
jgi:hypothetical protein